MITLKGAEVSGRLKEQVREYLKGMNGCVPTAAIVRVGQRPDDVSYERNVMKKIAAFGMEARSFVFPESISEEEFCMEFKKINGDTAIDGLLLLRPLPKTMDERVFERMIDPQKDLDGIIL